MSVLVREVVRPRWTFRLGRPSADGLTRRRGDGLVRLLHVDGAPVVVAASGVVFAARAADEAAALEGIARMRFAAGIDDDLEPFHERFRDDPLIGRAVRARPWLRVRRNPDPWETLMWAITEQLIDTPRAVAIQRRMIAKLGRRAEGLRDSPSAQTIADCAPAELEACGLAGKRALAMRRAAREVASGRVTFARGVPGAAATGAAATGAAATGVAAMGAAATGAAATGAAAPVSAAPVSAATGAAAPVSAAGLAPPRADFARLLAIPEIGTWTVEMLALHGLGRHEVVPAGDLGYLKLVGRLSTGNPKAVADEAEVRGFFAPYAPWAGLAAQYFTGGLPPPGPPLYSSARGRSQPLAG